MTTSLTDTVTPTGTAGRPVAGFADAGPGELLSASATGDAQAWAELVRRYVNLVLAVTRRHGLSTADAQDVTQTVWLRLVEHLRDIRDPQALGGWLIATCRHECLRQLRRGSRTVTVDPQNSGQLDMVDWIDVGDDLIVAERHQALRDGLGELAPHQRQLLLLLAADPPLSYAEISVRTGMPIGSIGPTRRRCLDKLRATRAISNYLASGSESGGGRRWTA